MMTWHFLLIFVIFGTSRGNWISDWMKPFQRQFGKPQPAQVGGSKLVKCEGLPGQPQRCYEVTEDSELTAYESLSGQGGNLRLKLEETLKAAKSLSKSLQEQINKITKRENTLKDIIVNGRSGVTVVKVSSLNYSARLYIIRDGRWSYCNGILKTSTGLQGGTDYYQNNDYTPTCLGAEVSTKRDPCAFNSIVKYETVPEYKTLEYVEDNYLCLKPTFNVSMEQYLSVPKKVVENTCKDGTIRSLDENLSVCGVRAMAEYTYYPQRELRELPVEYCVEANGACKLIVAWHIANSTIENFEFLKPEPQFTDHFIKSSSVLEHVF